MADAPFELFTSLRYDPKLRELASQGAQTDWNSSKPSPLYMLDYHRDRMLRAALHWGWDDAVSVIQDDEGLARLEAFILGLPEIADHPLRLKVTLSQDGKLGHEASRVPETHLSNLFPSILPPPGADAGASVERQPLYKIVADLNRTPASEYTHFKTTKREMYDSARQRAGITPAHLTEVLLVNASDGSIMEGSLTTPYFWRSGRWVTPPISLQFAQNSGSGGQDGTTRRWALERSLCVEEAVEVESLVDGEQCWISNGVRGFNCGRVSLHL